MLFVRCRRRKRTEDVLFSFPFIMEQKERTHFLSPFRKEERKSSTLSFPLFWRTDKKKKKGEPHLSFFIFPCRRWNGGSLPSLKKEKRKKKKSRRWKNADRRKKDKNEDGRKEGKRIKKRESEGREKDGRNGNRTCRRKAHS